MKLSTALRGKGLPLVLMYSIASILCCLTVPLMVPMVTADAPPHDVTFWVDPNVTTGLAAGQKVTVDIRINATGPAAIVAWSLYIQVNPDVLEPGWQSIMPPLPPKWAEANTSGYFLKDWCTANNYTHDFQEGLRNVTAGTAGTPAYPVTASVLQWKNFTQGIGANGTGKLVSIYFTSKSASAYTPILIKEAYYYTSWNAPDMDEHVPEVIHGHYNDPTGVHDVTVISVVPSVASIYRGWPGGVKFKVKVFNLGAYNETFNVTFSYNKTAIVWEFIGNYSFTLGLLETKTMSFLESPEWDTEYVEPSNYTIRANATLAGDTNPGNNVANTTVWVKPPLYDVAITAISAPTTATAGDTVDINVTAANLGTAEPVNLTVTVSYNPLIGNDTATLVANVTGTANFTFQWPTSGVSPGNYNITAIVSLWTEVGWDDTVPYNNENKTTITITVKDAAVTNVVPLESQGYPTWTTHGIDINVTVLNNGTAPDFNVTAYYGSSTWYEIGMQPVTSLGEGANTTLTFNWNLSGVAYGVYDIKANATLDGDTNLDNDEVIVYDAVKVKMVGDVDGNNYAGSWDLILLAAAYGSDLGDPDWNRQADFDDDTHVGSGDLVSLAAAYGTSY